MSARDSRTEERFALFQLLQDIAPWEGTAHELHKKLDWMGSIQSLSGAIRGARAYMETEGLSVRVLPKRNRTGQHVWSVELDRPGTNDQPKMLFDSREHESENNLPNNEGHEEQQTGLGIRLVCEISEETLKALFAVLSANKGQLDVATLIKKFAPVKHELFAKPENTKTKMNRVKPSQDPNFVLVKHKNDPHGKSVWVHRTSLQHNRTRYVEVKTDQPHTGV